MATFGGVYKDKRVLVTGHTGFKGSWLVTWLNKLGAEVCGLANEVPTKPSLYEAASLSSRVRDERADIRDLDRLVSVIRDFRPDFVFHLAAQAIVSVSYANPLETIGVNVMGTATVLEALRKSGRDCVCVTITSDKAYDNVEWPWGYRENDKLGGKDIYSGSKGSAELVFNSYNHSFFSQGSGVRLASARAGNVIGGGDWATDRIVADCIRAWLQDEAVQIRSPMATRPWQHVLEPLSGYLTLAQKLAAGPEFHGESYNFGPRGEQNATVLELLRSLAEVWGFDDPAASYKVTNNMPFHEASLLKLNIDKALLDLRWQPNLTYEECMRLTGLWYRDVLRRETSAFEMTVSHIEEYETLAQERQLIWAR